RGVAGAEALAPPHPSASPPLRRLLPPLRAARRLPGAAAGGDLLPARPPRLATDRRPARGEPLSARPARLGGIPHHHRRLRPRAARRRRAEADAAAALPLRLGRHLLCQLHTH